MASHLGVYPLAFPDDAPQKLYWYKWCETNKTFRCECHVSPGNVPDTVKNRKWPWTGHEEYTKLSLRAFMTGNVPFRCIVVHKEFKTLYAQAKALNAQGVEKADDISMASYLSRIGPPGAPKTKYDTGSKYGNTKQIVIDMGITGSTITDILSMMEKHGYCRDEVKIPLSLPEIHNLKVAYALRVLSILVYNQDETCATLPALTLMRKEMNKYVSAAWINKQWRGKVELPSNKPKVIATQPQVMTLALRPASTPNLVAQHPQTMAFRLREVEM